MPFSLTSKRRFFALLGAALLSAAAAAPAAGAVVLGISEFAPHEVNEPVISPTIEALRNAVKPETLVVRTLSPKKLFEAAKRGELNFVLSSAGNFRRMVIEGLGLRDLATVASASAPNPNFAEGSVFFTLGSRQDLKSLSDLKGKSVSANYPDAFSGWQIAQGEIFKRGDEPARFFGRQNFLGHGSGPVIRAVLNGDTDVGIVRSCTLERSGLLESGILKVIDPRPGGQTPCRHSTDLYPNWTIASTPQTSPELSRKAAAALLALPPVGEGVHWSVATDFTPIDRLFLNLRIGPYEYLRTFSFQRLVAEYWEFLVFAGLLLLGLIFHSFRSETLVRRRTEELLYALKRERAAAGEAAAAREKLGKLEKMGAVGQMCTMIAHDLRQPLGAVCSYSFGIRRRLERLEETPEWLGQSLEAMEREARKASDIVEEVRSYARGERKRTVINIVPLISETAKDLNQSQTKTTVTVRCRDPYLPVEAHPIEIEMIILNLAKNALEAIQNKEGAGVHILCSDAGKEITVCVSDDGDPISDQRWKLISEFAAGTSKRHGLGMGLALCKSLTEDLGGRLKVERRPYGGLSFIVVFPKYEKPSAPPADLSLKKGNLP